MNFLVNEAWENRNPFLQAFCAPGTRLYPVVEVALNGPLWHLDVLTAGDVSESERCWRRFLLTSVTQVLALLREQGSCESQLSFQSTTDGQRGAEYLIRKVRQIIAATTTDGSKAHVVICFDGTRIMQPAWTCLEEELLNKHYIYDCTTTEAEEAVVF